MGGPQKKEWPISDARLVKLRLKTGNDYIAGNVKL